MSAHTEGRLTVDPTGDCGDWYIGNADIMVAECICDDDFDVDADAINAANARRLVACWNAQIGATTEEVENDGHVIATLSAQLTQASERAAMWARSADAKDTELVAMRMMLDGLRADVESLRSELARADRILRDEGIS